MIRKNYFKAVVCIVSSLAITFPVFAYGPGDNINPTKNTVITYEQVLGSYKKYITNEESKSVSAVQNEEKQEQKQEKEPETKKETAKEQKKQNPKPVVLTDGEEVTVNGKTYIKKSDYGVHKLTGYTASAKYGSLTASDRYAKPNHTVAAASDLPFGTTILIDGLNGPYPDDYNGVYVVEDRGGYNIETSGWIDIYFDTYEESERVTHNGWNTAQIWILEEKK